MGAGMTAAADSADWERAERRVLAYLGAMGIADPRELGALCRQVRARAAPRAAAMPLEDPVEAAIEETLALLDRWLAAELGLEPEGPPDPDLLCAARAAVLSGAVPGWSARWAGLSDTALAAAIRSACRAAVPERAPLVMEPNPIHLCCYRLRRRIANVLYWLAGRAAGPTDHARSSQP